MKPKIFKKYILKKSKKIQPNILLPESEDYRIILAADKFISQKIGKVTLLGKKERIIRHMKSLGIRFLKSRINILDYKNSLLLKIFYQKIYKIRNNQVMTLKEAKKKGLDKNYFGIMMVYYNLVDGMVSGALSTTADTIRPALELIKCKNNISSIFFMLLKKRVVIYGDCAINIIPSFNNLVDIVESTIQTAKQFNITPKIAMLSYATGNSASGPTVEKIKNVTQLIKVNNPNLEIEGPIQYDAAVDEKIRRKKIKNSKLIGKANIFIFPDLNSGNNTYKAVKLETNTVAIGPILQGLKKPINNLSRGATVDDIYHTILVTSIQNQSKI
ncbi:phosphate acetyltransferase [Candidatus Karelsulcia muelleri]